jgi:hypothetical protein
MAALGDDVGAHLAGADQADADRFAFRLAFAQIRCKIARQGRSIVLI